MQNEKCQIRIQKFIEEEEEEEEYNLI